MGLKDSLPRPMGHLNSLGVKLTPGSRDFPHFPEQFHFAAYGTGLFPRGWCSQQPIPVFVQITNQPRGKQTILAVGRCGDFVQVWGQARVRG